MGLIERITESMKVARHKDALREFQRELAALDAAQPETRAPVCFTCGRPYP